MAYTKLILKHPVTHEIKEAPVGFSWTTMFFGAFVPAFRGDWGEVIYMIILGHLSLGLTGFVYMFYYNRFYIDKLVRRKGFKLQSVEKVTTEEIINKFNKIHIKFELIK